MFKRIHKSSKLEMIQSFEFILEKNQKFKKAKNEEKEEFLQSNNDASKHDLQIQLFCILMVLSMINKS